jgi:hypothetical protein
MMTAMTEREAEIFILREVLCSLTWRLKLCGAVERWNSVVKECRAGRYGYLYLFVFFCITFRALLGVSL